MATSTMVPLEVYLTASYEHDPEWVAGQLKERGIPDGYHGYFQTLLALYFNSRMEAFGLRALTEVRIEVNAGSHRIPDVMVLPADARFLPSPVSVPALCIEILSPDDRVTDLEDKIADYLAMGVGAIWIIDPRRRRMAVADAAGTHRVDEFTLPGTAVLLSRTQLFAELDELERLPERQSS